jgi:hypothetical protein
MKNFPAILSLLLLTFLSLAFSEEEPGVPAIPVSPPVAPIPDNTLNLHPTTESNHGDGFAMLQKIFEKQNPVQAPNAFQQIQQLEKKEYTKFGTVKVDSDTESSQNAAFSLVNALHSNNDALNAPDNMFSKLFTGVTKENSYNINGMIDPIKSMNRARKIRKMVYESTRRFLRGSY